MADLFTAEQRVAIRNLFDDMLDTFGKDCKLFYQPKVIPCSYCASPVNTANFSGTWTHGGPLPPHGSVCIYCNGSKTKTVETTEIIKMVCDWTPKPYQKIAENIRMPYGIIMTKGRLTDLVKLKSATKIQVQMPGFVITNGEYKLHQEPSDQFNIIQGRYFIAVLERIG